MADRTINFLLVAKDQASQAFKSAGDAAEKSGSKIGGALKTFGTGALLGAGAAAAAGIGAGAVAAFKGAQEAAQVTRVLENQIRNLGPTGRAAFGEASAFADTLGASIAKDDDDIKAVQAKLASFPNAFREGSLGAEAMRRATAAAFDLEAVGIGAAEGNIVGIGKALDNPIKGMSALTRAGVSFSDAQKTAIQQAVEQGDLAKAQSIILEGIESNAKGAAEAGASNIEKLKVAGANFAESLAGKVLPYVERFAGFLVEKLPAIETLFGQIGTAVSTVIGWFQRGGDSGGSMATRLSAGFQAMWAVAGPALRQIWQVISTQVVPAFSAFIQAATPVVTWLVATLGPTVRVVFGAVLTIIRGALTIISGVFNVFTALLTGDWSRLWTGVKQIASGAWTIIGGVFRAGIAVLSGIFSVAVGTLRAAAGRILSGISGVFSGAGSLLSSAGRRIIDGLIGGIQAGFARVRSTLASLTSLLPNWKGPARRDSKILYGAGRLVIGGFQRGLEDGYGGVQTSLGDLTSSLTPGRAGGRSGGGSVSVYVTQPLGTPDAIGAAVQDALARIDRRGYGY